MSYSILSENFNHPLLKPILVKLSEYFLKEQIKFYVIGATARDIILDIYGEKTGRATQDLDIAIAVSNWDLYEEIELGILKIEGFSKDNHFRQRFLYLDSFNLDIVPFGAISEEDDKIFWPPHEDIAMSVLGFSEVNESTHRVLVDDDLEIHVASLAGIFLLKIVAWKERHIESTKDADDIGFIINNYFSINGDRIYEENSDLLQADDFDTHSAGARLLGRDLAVIIEGRELTKKKIKEILLKEIVKEDESVLINQMLETNRIFRFEDVLKCLNYIVKGLDE